MLQEFRLTPARFNGTEVRLLVKFSYGPFAASRDLCKGFNLDYGSTVGMHVRIKKPDNVAGPQEFTELYATGNRVESLRTLMATHNGDLYATLLFCADDVKSTHAKFFGQNYHPWEDDEPGDGSVYLPPEGKIIMLFTKPA
jgi:hypothetical protein